MLGHAFPALLDLCGGSLGGLRVLEVACNSGGFSVEAARQGAEYVLATDVVDQYVEQAGFVRDALALDNVEVKKLSIYDVNPDTVGGEYDITLCFGLLYHLEDPVLAMRKLAAVTRRVMVVDTNTLPTPDGDRRALWRMNLAPEVNLTTDEEHNPRSTTNLWRDRDYLQFEPSNPAVHRLLRFVGFDKVRRVKPVSEGLSDVYYNGRRGTFLAMRDN